MWLAVNTGTIETIEFDFPRCCIVLVVRMSIGSKNSPNATQYAIHWVAEFRDFTITIRNKIIPATPMNRNEKTVAMNNAARNSTSVGPCFEV